MSAFFLNTRICVVWGVDETPFFWNRRRDQKQKQKRSEKKGKIEEKESTCFLRQKPSLWNSKFFSHLIKGAHLVVSITLHQRVNKVVPRRVRWAPESLSPSRGARHRCVFFFSQVVFEIIFWSIPTHACRERDFQHFSWDWKHVFFSKKFNWVSPRKTLFLSFFRGFLLYF